jgi:hypothetical protein
VISGGNLPGLMVVFFLSVSSCFSYFCTITLCIPDTWEVDPLLAGSPVLDITWTEIVQQESGHFRHLDSGADWNCQPFHLSPEDEDCASL